MKMSCASHSFGNRQYLHTRPTFSFSYQDVEFYLFGKRNTGLQPTITDQSDVLNDKEMPDIVRICVSTIPGANYGIQATQVIPEGAWIGPYKGKIISADEGLNGLETSCLWEIYKEGRLHTYIDGGDKESSSWMKFIQSARNKQEQNLYAFQYREKIYYRVYKTIHPGQELLVWYDDLYTQYLGIPCHGVYDMASVKGTTKFPGNLVVFAQEECLPVTPPSSPARSPPATGHVTSSLSTKNSCSKQDSQSSSHDQNPSSEQCGQCKKRFPQRGLLQTHICSSITKKPYQCGHCDERFANPGEMTVHVAIHQDKKPFKCGYCSRSFTGATTLNNHVRMHTGEKVFDCNMCGQTFTKGLQLSRHIKMCKQ